MVKNIAIWFLTGLFLYSCKMGPAFKSPEMETPDAYQYAENKTDSLGDIKWWELFNDPVLDSLILVALDSNRNVSIAANDLKQAQLLYKIQKVEMLPQINAQGNIAYGTYAGFLGTEANGNYAGLAAVSWELDFWGKLRRLNEAAMAEYLASEAGYQNLRLAIASEVAFLYFELRRYEASIEISERTVALRDSSVNLIQARYDKGIVAEIDLNQAQIQQAIAASAVPLYVRAAVQTENALSVLLGGFPTSIEESLPLDSLTVAVDIPIGLPSEILLSRPDVALATQLIVAQNASIGVAQAARFPSISLTGLLGVSNELNDFNSGGLAWNAGASLVGPIFNWGKNKRKVEIERVRTESAYLNYEAVIFNAFREVEDALIAIETYGQEIEARQNHVRAATNAQYLSSERYDKGITSYLEYLESQRQAFEAELALTAVRSELLASYIQLYKALGGGWLRAEEYGNQPTE